MDKEIKEYIDGLINNLIKDIDIRYNVFVMALNQQKKDREFDNTNFFKRKETERYNDFERFEVLKKDIIEEIKLYGNFDVVHPHKCCTDKLTCDCKKCIRSKKQKAWHMSLKKD